MYAARAAEKHEIQSPAAQGGGVRLDARVLDWLRSKGEGHLTRINDILTNLMEAEQRTRLRR